MTTTVFGDRKKSEHTSKKSDPVKKATSRKKSDIHLKNDQKSEKKQNDEFSHEKSKTGRFIHGPLFLPGALGGAFYPIYCNSLYYRVYQIIAFQIIARSKLSRLGRGSR